METPVAILRTKCCHIPTITAQEERTVVWFDSSWSRKVRLEEDTHLLKVISDHGITRLFHIAAEFCDEAETFVVDHGAKTLPCIALFNWGELELLLSIEEDMTPFVTALRKKLSHDDIQKNNLNKVLTCLESVDYGSRPARVFVSGDRSSVGKSTCCLYLLASLIFKGVKPCDLAYIKPITQCEAEQPVVRYCSKMGIANRGIGPVVFYKGFTRAFLDGNTESSEELLQSVVESVEEIERNKRIVIIDGVGYPAVGSICGISNADAARALNAPVLLVGKSGVGDAVDSFNINARYFESGGVRVLGCIFNKLPLNGFYNVESCRDAVSSYFRQFRTECKAYGFVPIFETTEETETSASNIVETEFLKVFMDHVDIGSIMLDIFKAQLEFDREELNTVKLRIRSDTCSNDIDVNNSQNQEHIALPVPVRKTMVPTTIPQSKNAGREYSRKRSRAEIEALAARQGAKGG